MWKDFSMVQKTAVIFEAAKGEKNDRIYQFIIPVGAPFGEVFDVAFELLAAAESLSKQAMENAKKVIDENKEKEGTAALAEEVKA
jgi:lysyl-tRNA synthetase class I